MLIGRHSSLSGARRHLSPPSEQPERSGLMRGLGYVLLGLFVLSVLAVGAIYLFGEPGPAARLAAARPTVPAPAPLPVPSAAALPAPADGATAEALSRLRTQVESETTLLAALRDQAEQGQRDLTDAQQQREAARGDVAGLEQQRDAARAGLADLQRQQQAAQAALVTLQGQQAAAKTALAALQGQQAAAKTALAALQSQQDAAKAALADVQHQVEAARLALAEPRRPAAPRVAPPPVPAPGLADQPAAAPPPQDDAALSRALERLRQPDSGRVAEPSRAPQPAEAVPQRSPPPGFLDQGATADPASSPPAGSARRRVFVRYPAGSGRGQQAATELAQRLLFSDFAYAESTGVPASTSAPMIRYFHPGDAEAAQHLGDLLRGSGFDFQIQNASGADARAVPGTIEVWIPS